MAGPEDFAEPPKLPELARTIAAEILNPVNVEKFKSMMQDVGLENMKAQAELGGGAMEWVVEGLTKAILAVLNAPGPLYNALGRAGISSLLGEGPPARSAPEDAGRKLIARLATGAGDVKPSIDGAANYLTLFLNEEMEAWVRGVAVEVVTEVFPRLMPFGGGIETFAKLEDIISDAMGGGRMVRRVLQPFINVSAITPAQWHVNKTYRPELLGVSDSVKQFLRGRWTREQLDEELARQGWSTERIDAFINAQRKFFGAGDVRTFVDRNHWPMDRGLQHLRDQGYDEDGAVDAIRLEGLRRIEQLEAAEANAIIAAFVDRRIGGGELRSMLTAAVKNPEERALLEELAEVRRATNIRHLSPGEAKAAVKENIISIIEYRRALERDGYTDEAVAALELLLRREMNDKRKIEDLRREQDEERAREKAERERLAAERRAQVEADRARRRRGPASDLERAVIRGLIPLGRLQEVLSAEYDADTVDILVALVEDDRQSYLDQQARADEARKRAGRRQLDVGTFERAVMAGLLTPDEFGARLAFLQFDPADAALLTAVVRAKKADYDAALAKRRQAEETAGRRRIDLGRFERLVRRGARSMAAYDALLAQLEFDDADRAAMRELLALQIADDRAADEERRAAKERLEPRGVSLEQLRRAVILGLRTIDDFEKFLMANNFTADAQALLLADLRFAVAEAEDARRRREQDAPEPGTRGLPLSTLQRAARLGIITPDLYAERLQAMGYDDDDLAVEMELLLLEIAETQAARAARAAAESKAGAGGLTLGQVERAVRAGALTIEDYRAAAIVAGLSPDAVDVVVAVLAQEAGTLTEARAIRAIVLRQLAAANVALEELEQAVTKGGQPIDLFVDELTARGIGDDEAQLVAALLLEELETAAATKRETGNG